MKYPKQQSLLRKSNDGETHLEIDADSLHELTLQMAKCRDEANKVLPDFDFKLYLQRVGQYAYLRWRGDSSVISTRDMKKRIIDFPRFLQGEIDRLNQVAEDLNLKYAMMLKIQKVNTED